jgi:predicted HTH transcriptional regulator
MLNHGLDQPLIGAGTGYFQVVFPGPGENLDRIRVPETQLMVTPAIEVRLNERQKKIIAQVAKAGHVTSGWCVRHLDVVKDTAHRNLVGLVDLQILVQTGRGRKVAYRLKESRD